MGAAFTPAGAIAVFLGKAPPHRPRGSIICCVTAVRPEVGFSLRHGPTCKFADKKFHLANGRISTSDLPSPKLRPLSREARAHQAPFLRIFSKTKFSANEATLSLYRQIFSIGVCRSSPSRPKPTRSSSFAPSTAVRPSLQMP